MEEIVIRDMSVDDLPQVHAIENLIYTDPWSINSFSYELGNSQAIIQVATSRESIIGYVCIRSILELTHLLKITVLPEFRRRGVAFHLLEKALQELRQARCENLHVTLEVRASNNAAISLYKKSGFKKNGRRKGYFRSPDEDAVIMGLNIQNRIGNNQFR